MFYLQTKAPAGNWVDSLGSEDQYYCVAHGKWLIESNNKYYTADQLRVIERHDVVVHEFNGFVKGIR